LINHVNNNHYCVIFYFIFKGPNFIWHLDGYDKLKRFGFCIHGCIDGFSRKILWLQVASTNNSPNVVASYFINQVAALKGSALTVRGDRGTENFNIAAIQIFISWKNGDNSGKGFLFGRSTANQRIEAWWSQLRKSYSQKWMNYFKDMADDGSHDESDSN